ncbi:hypothetical protein GQ42DRAFT_14330 [Ramicandelaber brevisporus]|nr:hypothetical protein GQ42DRAFT_14330 [Ramicandelaber brevisporus]
MRDKDAVLLAGAAVLSVVLHGSLVPQLAVPLGLSVTVAFLLSRPEFAVEGSKHTLAEDGTADQNDGSNDDSSNSGLYRQSPEQGLACAALLVPLAMAAQVARTTLVDVSASSPDTAAVARWNSALALSTIFTISLVIHRVLALAVPHIIRPYPTSVASMLVNMIATCGLSYSMAAILDYTVMPIFNRNVVWVGIVTYNLLRQYLIPQFLYRTFTQGEVAIIASTLSLLLCDCVNFTGDGQQDVIKSTAQSSISAMTVVASTAALASRLFVASPKDIVARLGIFGAALCSYAAITCALIYRDTSVEPISWLLRFIFTNPVHLALIAYWSALIGVSIAIFIKLDTAVVKDKRDDDNGGDTDDDATHKAEMARMIDLRRKYFHLLVVLMFVPGYIAAPLFLHLAFTVALAAFVCLECVRIFDLLPGSTGGISYFLQSFISGTDGRDAGPVVTSHFYLLIGCLSPVFLSLSTSPSTVSQPLPQLSVVFALSGVLVLGLGDSLASVCGKRFGRHRWPGTKKSIEGTAAFIVGSLLAISCITRLASSSSFSSVESAVSWSQWVFVLVPSVVFVALLEALSYQCDNIVLPVTLYALGHILQCALQYTPHIWKIILDDSLDVISRPASFWQIDGSASYGPGRN